jgi:hypothetical protein
VATAVATRLRAALVLAAALTMSCGERPQSLGAPSPTSSPTLAATVTPPASPSPAPSRLPGSSVRISVDGKELAPGAIGELADDRATIVVLTFPVAMDRASVETFLPRDATATWTDDRTVSLSVPATSSFTGFKIPEARSKDGTATIDLVIVAIQHAPSIVVSTFTVAELLGGARAPKADAPRVSAPSRGSTFMPSRDGTKLLIGSYDPTLAPARVFDLTTRALTSVPLPRTTVPFISLGWAGSDRIAFAGERVWVTTLGSASAREVVDPGIPFLTAAAASPRGSFVAAASRDKLVIVDLASGAVRTLSGYRNDCELVSSPLSRFAWSADERRIAVVECESTAPTVVRTRIIDIATDKTVGTVDGGIYGIAALLTGNFQVSLDYTERGEGARLPWVVYDFAGLEKMRYLGRGPTVSPDGHYLMDASCCAGEGFSLTDLTTGRVADHQFPGSAQWLADGRILVVTR